MFNSKAYMTKKVIDKLEAVQRKINTISRKAGRIYL